MSYIRCKIKLKDGEDKTIEKKSVKDANVLTLSTDIKYIQKEINKYLTEVVDKERAAKQVKRESNYN